MFSTAARFVEAGTGGLEGDAFDTLVDEAALFFSGGFGRFELGLEDGVEDDMYVGGEDAQAGTGGIDGDIPNINFVQFTTTDDAAKVSYFTPRLAGFQLGASFTPDYEETGPRRIDGRAATPRARTASAAAPTGLARSARSISTLAGVLLWGECESNCTNQTDQGEGFNDDQFSYGGGGLLEFGGFTLGAGYNRADDFAPETHDLDIVNVGLKYGFGDANVSFGYTFNGFSEAGLDDSNLFVVSGDIGLLPGVALLADVSYNTEDLGAFKGGVNGENEQDDTSGGGQHPARLLSLKELSGDPARRRPAEKLLAVATRGAAGTVVQLRRSPVFRMPEPLGFVRARRLGRLVRRARHRDGFAIPARLGFARQPRRGGLVQDASGYRRLRHDVCHPGLRRPLGFVRSRTMDQRRPLRGRPWRAPAGLAPPQRDRSRGPAPPPARPGAP